MHVNGDNTVTYTPQTNYFGADQFSYTIDNGHGGSAGANVTITVQAPLPPIAVNDDVATAFQEPVVIDALDNDSDPNGLPLTITQVTTPVGNAGTTMIAGNKITFTPDNEIDGDATFDYTISNGFAPPRRLHIAASVSF